MVFINLEMRTRLRGLGVEIGVEGSMAHFDQLDSLRLSPPRELSSTPDPQAKYICAQ
jgi:hypothetical protein